MGYFPTYTLGNLNAAQLMHAATKEQGTLAGELIRGEYGGLLKWLREKVHRPGSRYRPQELMQQATGESTQSRHHLDYLRQKFVN
jgi:carboxypeptidase Taq